MRRCSVVVVACPKAGRVDFDAYFQRRRLTARIGAECSVGNGDGTKGTGAFMVELRPPPREYALCQLKIYIKKIILNKQLNWKPHRHGPTFLQCLHIYLSTSLHHLTWRHKGMDIPADARGSTWWSTSRCETDSSGDVLFTCIFVWHELVQSL